MKVQKYQVVARVASFGAGHILALSNDQSVPRKHNLAFVKGHGKDAKLYQVVERVEFKAGEVIGVVGDVNKKLLSLLEEDNGKVKAPKEDDGDKKPEGFASKAAEDLAKSLDISIDEIEITGATGATIADVKLVADKREKAADEEAAKTAASEAEAKKADKQPDDANGEAGADDDGEGDSDPQAAFPTQ